MSQTAVTLPASLQQPEGSDLESWMQTRIARTSSPRPAACAALASPLGIAFSPLPGAGPACAVEQPQAVAALIAAMLNNETA